MFQFVLVGDPVAHSRSPGIHRRAFEITGIEGEYGVRTVGPGELEGTLDELRRGALQGVNVTMPLKVEAFEACDFVTAEAGSAGSVNTLRYRDGALEGHSTDTVAFREAYELAPPGRPLLILGSGGSARAALSAWKGDAFVSARDGAKAGVLGEAVAWGNPVEGAVVVNATPLGMGGQTVPSRVLEAASMLIDLPYGPRPTPAAAWARAREMPLVDGLEFLARQAAASFRWWTGIAVDSAPLIEAARNG